MLVPSCRPSDDTLHKLINISFRLHSFPVASRTGTTLFCAFKVEESDTAVPKVPKAYGLEKNRPQTKLDKNTKEESQVGKQWAM